MRNTMIRSLVTLLLFSFLSIRTEAFPQPSPYPISWDFKFDYATPRRIVVRSGVDRQPEAYWYMTFTVANLSREEHNFYPMFEMLTNEDKVVRSDDHIPPDVLETIKVKERNPRLESITDIAGKLRIGEDQARDGVAIWHEPAPKMGRFSIFVTGLSGESVILKDGKGNPIEHKNAEGKMEPVVLWKTLQINYHIPDDDKFPGIDVVELVDQQWVMR